jgi:hypothetical protein
VPTGAPDARLDSGRRFLNTAKAAPRLSNHGKKQRDQTDQAKGRNQDEPLGQADPTILSMLPSVHLPHWQPW